MANAEFRNHFHGNHFHRFVMTESKIVLTERLRKQGVWDEASKFRDSVRKRLQSEGQSRREANERAWEAMAKEYPPAPVTPLADLMEAEKKPAKRRSPEEIEVMLDECLAEAKEIASRATAKAEAWARAAVEEDPFNETESSTGEAENR